MKYVLMVIGGLLLLVFGCLLFLFVCTLFIDQSKEYTTDSDFFRFLLNTSTAIAVFFMGIKVKEIGFEKLPKDSKWLFVCNHRSNFDPILTWYSLRAWKPAFISKKENFSWLIFGAMVKKCCFMAIDRKNARNALVTIKKAAELLKAQTVSVGVYPEGTRSKSCELLPFHDGVFKIAQLAKVPIAVMSITGTEKIGKNLPFRRSTVELKVAEVIPVEAVLASHSTALGASIRQIMLNSIGNN